MGVLPGKLLRKRGVFCLRGCYCQNPSIPENAEDTQSSERELSCTSCTDGRVGGRLGGFLGRAGGILLHFVAFGGFGDG